GADPQALLSFPAPLFRARQSNVCTGRARGFSNLFCGQLKSIVSENLRNDPTVKTNVSFLSKQVYSQKLRFADLSNPSRCGWFRSFRIGRRSFPRNHILGTCQLHNDLPKIDWLLRQTIAR